MAEQTPDKTSDMAKATLADPRWFPLRFDVARREYHFAFIPAEVHRSIAFLREAKPSDIRVLPRAAVQQVDAESGPLHLIMHSGLGGSTLIARALAQPGAAVALQEPPILTDVIAYGANAPTGERDGLLAEVTRLLARPLSPGEAIVCKLSGIANGLAPSMLAAHTDSKLLCIDNPLEQLLASFAARGASGRMAGRQLLIGIRNSRMFAFQMSDEQLLGQTDFQLAALAWLSIQKMMTDTAEALGPTRAASITSEQLMRDSVEALSAIAAHFALNFDVQAVVASGLFSRHAKSGEPFDPNERAGRLADVLRTHRPEIDAVASWAWAMGREAGIQPNLPFPLLQRSA